MFTDKYIQKLCVKQSLTQSHGQLADAPGSDIWPPVKHKAVFSAMLCPESPCPRSPLCVSKQDVLK